MVSPLVAATIKYVLAREGKEIAQLDSDSIQDFAKKGLVRDSDLVWKFGEKDWAVAKDRDDLADSLKQQAEFNVAIDNKVLDNVMKHSDVNEMLEKQTIAADRVRVWRPGLSQWENVSQSADFPQFTSGDVEQNREKDEETGHSNVPKMTLPNKPPTPWDNLK